MTTIAPTRGERHVSSIPGARRRMSGTVYTPEPLAEFVLDRALLGGATLQQRVLDPACGAGVFLAVVVKRIAAEFAEEYGAIGVGNRALFLTRVSNLVWGYDIDAAAVVIAREELRDLIQTITPGPLPRDFLNENIRVHDFLRDRTTASFDPPQLIIGNPPYVSIDRIERRDREEFRSTFRTAYGRVDLYTLFMERAVSLLEAGGVLAFITPDKYLTSQSARPLRELLVHLGSIQSIARFQSHRVFADAATVPCVTVWRAGESCSATFEHTSVRAAEGDSTDLGAPAITNAEAVPRSLLLNREWTLVKNSAQALIAKIASDHPKLSERTTRISAGLTTGLNPAFIVRADDASLIEPQLIHPTLRGRDIRAGAIREPDHLLLLPYEWTPDGTSKLIDLAEHPGAHRWLEGFKDRLMDRHCVRVWGKSWWDIHDPVSLPLHSTPKVVVPDLARSNRFAADGGRFVPQHSAYYLIPDGISEDILAAVLNSAPLELLVRSTAPLVKDGFSRYRKQFLRTLPIPYIDEQMETEIRKRLNADAPSLDDVAAALFGVDMSDVHRALRALPQAP